MSYFYWNTIKDNVTAFGDAFNNIKIKRYATNPPDPLFCDFDSLLYAFNDPDITFDNIRVIPLKEIKIPISYSNGDKHKERFLLRGNNPDDMKDLVKTTLPRMGFQISDIHYDADRKLNKMHKILLKSTLNDLNQIEDFTIENFADEPIESFTNDTVMSVFTPVPYVMRINLFILTSREEDSNQILEQILPKFTPEYNIPIKYIFGPILRDSSSIYRGRASVTFDSPLTLNHIIKEDSFEGDFNTKTRTILHTLTFSLRCKFFRDFNTEKLIKKLSFNVTPDNLLNLGELTNLFTIPSDEKNVINFDNPLGWINDNQSIIELNTMYDKFYNDMYQDTFGDGEPYNIGDSSGLV